MAPTVGGAETNGSPRYWLLVVSLLLINTYALIDRAVRALLVEPIKRDIGAGVASFFLGTSYSVGATTLGEITPVRLMGRVTAIYFLFVSLFGQALGPFFVGYGSQNLFVGTHALASSFALFNGLFGLAMLVSVLLLRQRLRCKAESAKPEALQSA
jgi:MFS family permease